MIYIRNSCGEGFWGSDRDPKTPINAIIEFPATHSRQIRKLTQK